METLREGGGRAGHVTLGDMNHPRSTQCEVEVAESELQSACGFVLPLSSRPQLPFFPKHGRNRGRFSGATQVLHHLVLDVLVDSLVLRHAFSRLHLEGTFKDQ